MTLNDAVSTKTIFLHLSFKQPSIWGKPIVVLLHNTEMRTLLGKTIVSGMDHLHNGLGSRLKERLEKFRRYIIDFGVPDDNFEAILDRICVKRRN